MRGGDWGWSLGPSRSSMSMSIPSPNKRSWKKTMVGMKQTMVFQGPWWDLWNSVSEMNCTSWWFFPWFSHDFVGVSTIPNWWCRISSNIFPDLLAPQESRLYKSHSMEIGGSTTMILWYRKPPKRYIMVYIYYIISLGKYDLYHPGNTLNYFWVAKFDKMYPKPTEMRIHQAFPKHHDQSRAESCASCASCAFHTSPVVRVLSDMIKLHSD